MAKNLTRFVARASMTLRTHLGNEVRITEGTILGVSKQGKLVIPAHSIRMGKKGEKQIPAVTTDHMPIELCKWLALVEPTPVAAPKA
jgi:hypothetical protein